MPRSAAADIAGDSRLRHADEAATARDLKAHQRVIQPLIGRHGGRIIDTAGDSIRAESQRYRHVRVRVQIQTVMAERNEGVPEQGDAKRSVTVFEDALRIDPDNSQARAGLAHALTLLHRIVGIPNVP